MSEPGARADGVYALLSDGTTALIRQAAPGDFDAVKAMHEQMSPENTYLRFFSVSRLAPEREARRICREPDDEHAALLVIYDGQVVGVASYEVARDQSKRDTGRRDTGKRDTGKRTAEVAFAVADFMHQRGIATLLLEHLVSLARSRRLSAFTAETLSENTGMLRMFSDAGLPVKTRRAEGTVEVTIPLPLEEMESYLDTVSKRERDAGANSLAPVFAPESVAVIGASRRPGTVGRSVLDNIRAGGFAGKLYAVNRNAGDIGGVPSFPDVASLPEAPDLALIAVPPPDVADAAETCGE
ncbi:MAG: GNAT family N-acetyltransferase, partial [Nocardiopsaceae bacterium]|nr:GNAT family N-acetyltransferase [Nocardiopsaceae bacterium]